MNNTLLKGLQLLELLVRGNRPIGLTELAVSLGIGKSNVHRLLQGLLQLGYVNKDADRGAYQITLKIWELAQAMDTAMPLRAAATDAMNRLLLRTRETVHLSVLDGSDVVYVAKLDSPEPVRAYSEVGGRAPAHCVATGKALLAWQPKAALASAALQLKRYTTRTIVEKSAFLQEMERVRSQGFAVNRGEWREEVWGIAAPIMSQTNVPLGAIGVSGPSSRIKPSQIRSLAEEVISAAAAIAKDL